MRMMKPVVMLGLVAALSACSYFAKKPEPTTTEATAEKAFAEAREALSSADYPRAIKLFEAFEARFPYGAQAQQAILDGAWANYKTGEYATAVGGAERFIKLYPAHANVDYAYFLKGLSLFGDELGLFKFFANEDITERDPKARREAYATFRELTEKFPNSKYADDSRLRMQHLLNSLAAYEVHVAQYYLNRGAHVAAVNRAQAALTTYPETPATKDALQILSAAYTKLGKPELARDADRIRDRTFTPTATANPATNNKAPWWKFWAR